MRDTARLSQRYLPILRYGVFLVSQHGELGAIPPPPFLGVCPLESMQQSRGAIPPPPQDTISKGYCAIWGVSRIGPGKVHIKNIYKKWGELTLRSRLLIRYSNLRCRDTLTGNPGSLDDPLFHVILWGHHSGAKSPEGPARHLDVTWQNCVPLSRDNFRLAIAPAQIVS